MRTQVEETIEVIRPALQADGGDIVLKEVDEVTGIVYVTLAQLPSSGGLMSQLIRVGVPVGVGSAAYCGLYRLLGGRELGMLLHGRIDRR